MVSVHVWLPPMAARYLPVVALRVVSVLQYHLLSAESNSLLTDRLIRINNRSRLFYESATIFFAYMLHNINVA